MEKIKSFTINHDKLLPGLYVSRVDGDVITYDVRMKRPNMGDYLSTGEAHTVEHLFATYVRNSIYGKDVIYCGPMGCRTGFYLLMRNNVSQDDVIRLVQDSMRFIAGYKGEIPGASRIECGNYLDQDLKGARKVCKKMIDVLKHWKDDDMRYEE